MKEFNTPTDKDFYIQKLKRIDKEILNAITKKELIELENEVDILLTINHAKRISYGNTIFLRNDFIKLRYFKNIIKKKVGN